MKSNKVNASLALKIITSDYQPEHDELCARMQYAIDHDASVLLTEGDKNRCDFADTTMRDVYSGFDKNNPDYLGEFEGWSDIKRIIVIYFDRATEKVRKELLAQYFTPTILEELYAPYNTNWFDSPESMAVRVENNDGSWYEHIISWSKPLIKNGRDVSKW